MTQRFTGPRRLAQVTLAGLAATIVLGAAATTGYAASSTAASGNASDPAYQHSYRHGLVPTLGAMAHAGAVTPFSQFSKMSYQDGTSPLPGVTNGHEKVYLVFWGKQWGTQSTDSNGNVKLSGDSVGMAGILQQFFKGLGVNNELWSGVMTQYCSGVAVGATSCPSSAAHVAYPTGGALSGVFVDESANAPSAASGKQLGTEANTAAAHFGNSTQSSNSFTQYVIVSPHGTNPDNYKTNGFCAWHDSTADGTLSGGSPGTSHGNVAFTNLPYLTDVGASCGANFVNSGTAGTKDGITIVEGHEYAETITDMTFSSVGNPGGWLDPAGPFYETGDKCAWLTPGTTGGAFDLKLSTGSYAVQTTYANDGRGGAASCEGSHPIVT
jgi:serine protease